MYSLACEQAKDINFHLCQNLGKTNKILKSRMRKVGKKIPRYPRFPTWLLSDCFFKVQCKMGSDVSKHELIKIDHKESIRCHILKCFEISWVH